MTNEKYTGDALLQKTYVTDCITKKTRKNNGELPIYLVKNHHEPIISRDDFNRVQEEMARRSAKRSIAEKLTKTEQGKYSAKYALSELLICGECGEQPEEQESTDFSDGFAAEDADEDEELYEEQDEFEDQRMSMGMQIKKQSDR